MSFRSTFRAVLVCSVGVLVPVGGAVAQKGPGDPDPAITLQLLVQDQQGRQSQPVAEDLARLAEELTGGAITIEVTFADGDDVAGPVMRGEVELGMLPSREWDAVGVTSLDVLEAPFLITDDALALAVATDPIAQRAMAGLDAVGVTGLAMWPEDLRHLFGMQPSRRVFRSPADLQDADVLVVAGTPGHDLITTLGGRIYDEGTTTGELSGDRFVDAEAGTLEGMVTGLWGAGLPTEQVTVAGDLVVYTKYQMLVANRAVLDSLSERQRGLLGEVVAAMHQAALGRHFTERELALVICDHGGQVIEIGPQAIEAFRVAARPLTDQLAADPVTGPLMAAVADLAATTTAAPGAGTCGGEADARGAIDYPVGDTAGTSGALPPNGTYRAILSQEELVAKGADPDWAGENDGVADWAFRDGSVSLTIEGQFEGCTGRAVSRDGGSVSLVTDPQQPCGMDMSFRWAPTRDGIRLVTVEPERPWSLQGFLDNQAWLDREWIRLDGPLPSAPPAMAGLPIPGTWRIEHTLEDRLALGVGREFAEKHTGQAIELAFDGARWAGIAGCGGPYHLDDGWLHLQFDRNEPDCGTAPVDLRWVAAGPDVAQVAPSRAFDQDEVALFTGEWVRVGEPPATLGGIGFVGDRPVPEGTYRVDVTAADLQAAGASADHAGRNDGTWTWTFTDGAWSATHGGERCHGSSAVAVDHIEMTDLPTTPCAMGYDLRWRLEGDGIRFQVLDANWFDASPTDLRNERAITERVWTRVEDAPGPSGFIGDRPVPPGADRAEMTVDGLVMAGASPDFAKANQGTWTWTFGDGAWAADHGRKRCTGSVSAVDGVVQTLTEVDDGCGMSHAFRWRDAEGGIEVQSVGVSGDELSARQAANERAVLGRVWLLVTGEPEPTAEPAAFVGDRLPPDGVYRADVTLEDLVARGATRSWATDNVGLYAWELLGGPSRLTVVEQPSFACQPTWTVAADGVQVAFDGRDSCTAETVTVRWRLDGDQLTLQVVSLEPANPSEHAWWERAWQRIGDAPAPTAFVPPDGSYRVELTAADLTAAGGDATYVGIQTWTFRPGSATWTFVDAHGVASSCEATIERRADMLRLTYTSGEACVGVVEDVRWEPVDGGIAATLVAIQNADFAPNAAAYSAKPFVRLPA